MKLQVISTEKLTSLEALEEFEITPKAPILLVMVDQGHMSMFTEPRRFFTQLRDHYVHLCYLFKAVYLFPGQFNERRFIDRAVSDIALDITRFIAFNYPNDGIFYFVTRRALSIVDEVRDHAVDVISTNLFSPISPPSFSAPPVQESLFRRLLRRVTESERGRPIRVLRGEIAWLNNEVADAERNDYTRFAIVLSFPTFGPTISARYLDHEVEESTLRELYEQPMYNSRKVMFWNFEHQGDGCTSDAYCNGTVGMVTFGTAFPPHMPAPCSIDHDCDGFVLNVSGRARSDTSD